MLNYMLIKHKNIFECFNCFLKVFLFWKFSNISKIVQLYFGDSVSQVKPVMSSQSRAYTKALGNSLVGQAPSHEKDLEKFLKSGFLAFSRLCLAISLRVEAPITSLLRLFRDSFRNLLASGPSSHEKYLDKFWEICHTSFWQLDLATCSRLNLVAKNACFAP